MSRNAAGTPSVSNTEPSEVNTRDGGLMNSGSMNQRAAISQAMQNENDDAEPDDPGVPKKETPRRLHAARVFAGAGGESRGAYGGRLRQRIGAAFIRGAFRALRGATRRR